MILVLGTIICKLAYFLFSRSKRTLSLSLTRGSKLFPSSSLYSPITCTEVAIAYILSSPKFYSLLEFFLLFLWLDLFMERTAQTAHQSYHCLDDWEVNVWKFEGLKRWIIQPSEGREKEAKKDTFSLLFTKLWEETEIDTLFT